MASSLSDNLSYALEVLGYTDSDGVITRDTITSDSARRVGPREYLWNDLGFKVGLDAAFFHDGVPLVGFTDAPPGPGLEELRKRLWNYGRVPILVTATDEGITPYNGLENPNPLLGKGQLEATLDLRSTIARDLSIAFSRKNVEAGEFTAQHQAEYQNADRVDKGLFTNLRHARRKFTSRGNQERAAFDTLVGACITASFLAARGVLDRTRMGQLAGVSSVEEALHRGRSKTSALFAGLAERFNGDVFENSVEALAILDDSACHTVAALLRGDNLQTGQGALWAYDFGVLPSDLVTGIYEQLLDDRQRQDAAYYTPRAIVDLILDEVLPWDDEKIPSIIDLACGSGAFITEAFRRITFKARWQRRRRLEYPELRDLLTGHIFGIDVNPDAAKVAAFGTYLALLEAVNPPTIWDSVTLPRLLDTNIIVSDAFDNHPLLARKFDAVVSNPPWKSSLSKPAKRFISNNSLPNSDKQLAQAFVWLATDMLRPGGMLGLVLPSRSVLHGKGKGAEDFRLTLFNQMDVRSVIDLSPIRRELFAAAISPTALLIAQKPSGVNSGSDDVRDQEIIHVAVHLRPFTQASGALVIAPEDLHVVRASHARTKPGIWKTLVWGTARDLDFLDRVRAKYPTLGEVLEQRGWEDGQGYKAAPELPQKDASFLIGKRIVDLRSISPMRSPSYHRERFSRPTLHRPRDAEQYRAPQVIVRQTLPGRRIAATFLEEDAAYSSELMSIAGPPEDAEFLRLVAAVLCSSYGNYWQFMTGGSWGIERDKLDPQDLPDMPLPCATLDELDPTLRERLRDLAMPRPHPDQRFFAELDAVIFDLFNFRLADRRRIIEGLTGKLGWFARGRNQELASDNAIEGYMSVLGSALGRSMADVTIQTGFEREDNYITVWLSFIDERAISAPRAPGSRTVDTEAILRAGREDSLGTTGLVSLPAAFLVDDDTVYLVKTADSDRWTHDTALDDGARILTTLAFGE
jgi:N-6 DNA Methylase